jgi:hypothetical protein
MLVIAGLTGCGSAPASSEFPAAYVGRWGESPEGCSPGAVHGGLTIRLKSVADGEFEGKVRSISRKSDGSIDVSEVWDVPEQGLTTFTSNYRLSPDQNALLVREISGGAGNEPLALVRCNETRS